MTEQAKCMGKDCAKPARWQVGFRIWLLGMERRPENASPALTTLVVCDDCRSMAKAEDFFPPDTKVRIAHQFGRSGAPMPPDFGSAEMTFSELFGKPLDMHQLMTEIPEGMGKPKGSMN